MEVKTMLFVTILLVSVSWTFGIDEVPEFQYPCYVDVCTFPRQYCNSDERRCSPCSRAICHSPKVPTACRYLCIKYKEVTTTTTPVPKTATTIQNETTEIFSFTSLHLLMIYSVVSTSTLIVMVAVLTICYCRRKDMSNSKHNQGLQYARVENGKQDNIVRDDRQPISDKPVNTCPACGQLPQQRPFPENHQTNICMQTLTGPPSYKALDSRSNLRAQTPLVATPSDSTESKVSVVTNASPDGAFSMNEKPWPDGAHGDLDLQRDLMHSHTSHANNDNTRRKHVD